MKLRVSELTQEQHEGDVEIVLHADVAALLEAAHAACALVDPVLVAAEEWAQMWDSFRESGLEPVLCPEEEKLDAAIRALREATK